MQNQELKDVQKDYFFFFLKKKKRYLIIALKNCLVFVIQVQNLGKGTY